jgi:hypothetical protein
MSKLPWPDRLNRDSQKPVDSLLTPRRWGGRGRQQNALEESVESLRACWGRSARRSAYATLLFQQSSSAWGSLSDSQNPVDSFCTPGR